MNNTDAGLDAMIGKSANMMRGKTTFRDERKSLILRLFSVFWYPISVIGALIQPLIWFALVTAFSPSAPLTPVLVRVTQLSVTLVLMLYFIPVEFVSATFPTALEYKLLVQEFVNRILNAIV
jgi:hypothetical protein